MLKKQKKNQDHQYWIYGNHAVNAVIKNKRRKILKILVSLKKPKSFIEKIKKDITVSNKKIIIEQIQNTQLEKLFHNSNHQGIAALIEPFSILTFTDFIINNNNNKKNISVMLSNLNDPHNFGAIIRSAVAFNITDIFISNKNTCKESHSVSKVSSGGIEMIKLYKFGNTSNTINQLKINGWFIIGLDASADLTFKNINKNKLIFNKIIIIMGSESKGIGNLIKNKCDILIKIPINMNNMNSLNVSCAASIAFYEAQNLVN